MSTPTITVDWATGANGVLAEVSDAVAAAWPIGALVIGLFVGYRIVRRFVKG